MTPAESHARRAADFTERVNGVAPDGWDAPSRSRGGAPATSSATSSSGSRLPRLGCRGASCRRRPSVDEDPVGRLARPSRRRPGAPRRPGHCRTGCCPTRTPATCRSEAVDRFYTADVFMHTWDLARATGQDETLDEEMCRTLYEGMLPMEEVLRASGQFGGHVEVEPDADVQTRLLALIGRRA